MANHQTNAYSSNTCHSGIGALIDNFPYVSLKINHQIFPSSAAAYEDKNSFFYKPDRKTMTHKNIAVFVLNRKRLLSIIEKIYSVHCQKIDSIVIPAPIRFQSPWTGHTIHDSFIKILNLRNGLPCAVIQFGGHVGDGNGTSEKYRSLYFSLGDILTDALNCQSVRLFEIFARPCSAGEFGVANQHIASRADPYVAQGMQSNVELRELELNEY